MQKNINLIKALSIYLVYFLYTYYSGYFISLFSFISPSIVMIFLDVLFILLIVFLYYQNIQDAIKNLQENFSLKKLGKIIAVGVFSILALNILMGVITTIFFPNSDIYADQNTLSIQRLSNLSTFYTIFKTMIFGVIAEELLFRESLNNCIENDWLFILLTSVIYACMNLVFTEVGSLSYTLIELVIYFLPAVLLGFIYTKNNRNIALVMIIKFIYNLIPLAILLLEI